MMMAGQQPFYLHDGQLCLAFKPALPGWLFDQDDQVTFKFLGDCTVVYHNPARADTFREGVEPYKIALDTRDGQTIELDGSVIAAPHAALVRAGQVRSVRVFFGEGGE